MIVFLSIEWSIILLMWAFIFRLHVISSFDRKFFAALRSGQVESDAYFNAIKGYMRNDSFRRRLLQFWVKQEDQFPPVVSQVIKLRNY